MQLMQGEVQMLHIFGESINWPDGQDVKQVLVR
jgi:hypothetical protein